MLRVIVPTVLGALLVVVTLRDVFHELFNPSDRGSLSAFVTRATWRVMRVVARAWRGILRIAGPTILVAVATTWATLLLLAWALVYWPRLPESFSLDPTLPASATRGFGTALYVSLSSITTLGSTGMLPLGTGLRLAVALESLVGPVILTAWITWVLSIQPLLADRRALSREVALLRRAQPDASRLVRDTPRDAVAELLRSLSEQMLRVSAQTRASRVTYYFTQEVHDAILVEQLPFVLALARSAEREGPEAAIRHAGAVLRMTIEDFLAFAGEQFLDMRDASPDEILAAIARDHMLDHA